VKDFTSPHLRPAFPVNDDLYSISGLITPWCPGTGWWWQM